MFNREQMRKITVILLGWVLLGLPAPAAAQERVHTVFFQGTDHELNVYRIRGKQPGKTILLIGGIQGDEPGGFLSVDMYADISLARGNLIVVPRANFRSIVLQRRQINEDMNRKFGTSQNRGYETEVVEILKQLIAESDCLLNMHDGSGFFSEKWESPSRNPQKYGQSIIADAGRYQFSGKTEPVELEVLAREVCQRINQHIKNPEHFFRFNNHRTAEQDSRHKEQRKSATFYALTQHGIPAFGIESSKSLPLELKVRHHNLAVNAFMEVLGVVPQTPGMSLKKPLLDYLVIAVNDTLPVVLKNQQTLHIAEGDTVTISHIEANYERGLSADLVGLGTVNDLRKPTTIRAPTRIVVRKDYYPCGSVYIDIGARKSRPVATAPEQRAVSAAGLLFKVKKNSETQVYNNYSRIKMIRGDIFEIVDVLTSLADPSDLVVNVKGFVGNRVNNSGEDRGYPIDSSKDLWKRYSLHKQGRRYQVIVTLAEKEVGKLFIELEEPLLKHVIFSFDDGSLRCFFPGNTIDTRVAGALHMVALSTNIRENQGVSAYLSAPEKKSRRVDLKAPLFADVSDPGTAYDPIAYRLEFRRGNIEMGTLTLAPGKGADQP